MNDIENSSGTRLPEAELRRHLRAYLLSSEHSLMAVVVEQIIKAYRFKLVVEVMGKPLIFRSLENLSTRCSSYWNCPGYRLKRS